MTTTQDFSAVDAATILVDDQVPFAHRIKDLAASVGVTGIEVTASLKNAETLLQSGRFTRVVADWKVTGSGDGLEFLLRAKRANNYLECRLLTGFAEQLNIADSDLNHQTLSSVGIGVVSKSQVTTANDVRNLFVGTVDVQPSHIDSQLEEMLKIVELLRTRGYSSSTVGANLVGRGDIGLQLLSGPALASLLLGGAILALVVGIVSVTGSAVLGGLFGITVSLLLGVLAAAVLVRDGNSWRSSQRRGGS